MLRVGWSESQSRRSRSAEAIFRSLASTSASLRRNSAHCTLVRKWGPLLTWPLAPEASLDGARGGL
jgi:hypothetical protein